MLSSKTGLNPCFLSKSTVARVVVIKVPLSYADELYVLRQHIDLVRERLRATA